MAVRKKHRNVVWHFIKESQLDITQFDYVSLTIICTIFYSVNNAYYNIYVMALNSYFPQTNDQLYYKYSC